MAEKKSFHPPTTFSSGRFRPVVPDEDVRWKSLCADHPEIDPRQAERFLARLPKALIDDCEDRHLIDFLRRWESAQGDPPVALTLSAADHGFSCAVMSDSHRGAIACVATALEGEGFYFTGLQLWIADQPPRADVEDRPLFVIEADLAGPLPKGISTTEEAAQRLLDRLRPAFALLKQGDFGRAQSCTAGVVAPEANGPTAPEVLTPR